MNGEVQLSTRRPALFYAAMILIMANAVLARTVHHTPLLSLFGALSSLVGSGLMFTWFFWRRRESGALEVRGDAVHFAGRPLFARAKVKSAVGFGAGDANAVRVVMQRATYALDFSFARPEEANAFLTALAQRAEDTTATFGAFAGGRRTRTWFLVGMILYLAAIVVGWVALAGFGGFDPGSLASTVALALIGVGPILAATRLLGRQLVVGTDGVLVKRPFGKTDFFPFRTISAAETDGADLVLSLTDESSPRRFAVGGSPRFGGADADVPVRALVQRIEEARARGERGDGGANTSALLARGRRSAPTWMRELAHLADAAATFRSSAIPRDHLWRVVEDATASTELRAGAALALRRELGEAERLRFRVVSNVSAEPALRRVFLAVGSDDEARLTAAVDELGTELRSPLPPRES